MLGSPRAPLLHNRLLYLNSVLRAERSAAALRFARSTVGQICKPCKVKQWAILDSNMCRNPRGIMRFSKQVVQNAVQMLQDGIFQHRIRIMTYRRYR